MKLKLLPTILLLILSMILVFLESLFTLYPPAPGSMKKLQIEKTSHKHHQPASSDDSKIGKRVFINRDSTHKHKHMLHFSRTRYIKLNSFNYSCTVSIYLILIYKFVVIQ